MPRSFYLYYVTEPRKAIRYGCGVGRAGLEFTGTATIDVKKEWPTWRPTDEMIEREPVTYAKFKDNDYVQPGGGDNPLGARALYLFQNGVDTYFRIHGTTQPQTIGRAASNGCIRMLNSNMWSICTTRASRSERSSQWSEALTARTSRHLSPLRSAIARPATGGPRP